MSRWLWDHRATPCVSMHLKDRNHPHIKYDKFHNFWLTILYINSGRKAFSYLVLCQKIREAYEIKCYRWIWIRMPIVCRLPRRIESRAPHLDIGGVATRVSPSGIIDLTGWRSVSGMVWREGHYGSLRIVTPLRWGSWIRPSPVIFLGQDMSPLHSIFLFEIEQVIH